MQKHKTVTKEEDKRNMAPQYAQDMMKSVAAITDGNLFIDYCLLKRGCAQYIPNFFSENEKFSMLRELMKDLETFAPDGHLITWSKHFKHENPQFSPKFNWIVNQMAEYFDVEVFATRLNFYCDESSWKPFHHDSHAYLPSRKCKEDFTMGASFGCTRALVFRHEKSKQEFSFPQNNGDVFCFDTRVNTAFLHGVPKSASSQKGPRFSVIAWGRRRSINFRNGCPEDYCERTLTLSEETIKPPITNDYENYENKLDNTEEDKEKLMISKAVEMVDKFVTGELQKQEKLNKKREDSRTSKNTNTTTKGNVRGRGRGRVMGGWAAKNNGGEKKKWGSMCDNEDNTE